MNSQLNDLAIVLIVFDGYEDLWDDAIRLMKKNWQDHPNIYVFSNEKMHEWSDVTCVAVGKNAEWSKKVQKAIEVVNEKYIVLLLEDFFVGKPIKSEKVNTLIRFMSEHEIKYCKLCDNNTIIHKPKKKYLSSNYEVIYADEEYGISLQASLWEKDYLANIVGKDNYNAWEFELNQLNAEKKAEHTVLSYAIEDPTNVLNIKHGVLQGEMIPTTVAFFKKKGDSLRTNRKLMTRRDFIKVYLKFLGRNIVPTFAKSSVKSIASLFGYSFIRDKWSK